MATRENVEHIVSSGRERSIGCSPYAKDELIALRGQQSTGLAERRLVSAARTAQARQVRVEDVGEYYPRPRCISRRHRGAVDLH